MPEKAGHSAPPLKVDAYNNFFRRSTQDGRYHPITVKLEPKVTITNVKTYKFEEDAIVILKETIPGASSVEHVRAKAGDLLIIWSDGRHKIVPPDAQKWVRDLVE